MIDSLMTSERVPASVLKKEKFHWLIEASILTAIGD